jgi:hypothetical protein
MIVDNSGVSGPFPAPRADVTVRLIERKRRG